MGGLQQVARGSISCNMCSSPKWSLIFLEDICHLMGVEGSLRGRFAVFVGGQKLGAQGSN